MQMGIEFPLTLTLPEGEGWGEGELGWRRFRRLRISAASLWRSFWLQRHNRKPVF